MECVQLFIVSSRYLDASLNYNTHQMSTGAQCPSIPPLANGRILTTSTQFNAGDEVSFLCDLGYMLNGSIPITCGEDGEWSQDPAEIECIGQ